MARQFDDGSQSAARRDAFMERVRDKLVNAPAPDAGAEPEKTLDELMADFYGAVSRNRKREVVDRFNVTSRLPDENGNPDEFTFKTFLKVIPLGLKMLWEDMFDRENAQTQKAQLIAKHIDRTIEQAGGNITEIQKVQHNHDLIRDLDRNMKHLEEALVYLPIAIGFNNITPMGTGGRLANASNAHSAVDKAILLQDKVRDSLKALPGFADTFPDMKVEHVGFLDLMASPFTERPGEVKVEAKHLLDGIRQYREKFDRWDVMAVYHQSWEMRAAACDVLGLNAEAEACRGVAVEYDVNYFESLDKKWQGDFYSVYPAANDENKTSEPSLR